MTETKTAVASKREMAKAHEERSARFSDEVNQTEGITLVRTKDSEGNEQEKCTPPPINPADLKGLSVESMFKLATGLMVFIQVAIIIIFATCSKIAYVDDFSKLYQMFTGIEIMMFFGFGYLMTFLKRYGMGAVGFTMLITVVGLQWGILTEAFFKQWYANEWGFIHVDLMVAVEGLFLVAALLISYGAIIGKVSPLQLVLMTFLEAIFYSLNKAVLLLGVVDLVDAGGTVNIHMFGCYFGLAVAWMIGKPPIVEDAEGGHVADLFSLIGTIFLWIYWPSFNGGALEADSHPQQRALVGTIFALCASTVGAFVTSSCLSATWKIRPVDIQNATLAGGVALGAVCHMTLSPADCLLIGAAAGIASTAGFSRLQVILDDMGLHDTCGVHNLHGIPSIIGGFASVILAAYKGPLEHDMPSVMEHRDQWTDQFASIAMTLGVAIVSGLATGWIMTFFAPRNDTLFYSDEPYWEVMDDFGRSIEQDLRKNLSDLEAGLAASRSLRDIFSQYASVGSNVGFMDFSAHSKRSSQNDEDGNYGDDEEKD